MYHVAEILEEEKRNLTVLYDMKVGELLSLACERAFISPSVLDHGKHMGDWQQLMLDTAKELSDLSQKIALSTTSAELVEQELKGCRKKERESRWKDVQQGERVFHSTPFQPRPVVGSPEADDGTARTVANVLQDIGMEADDARVPSPEIAQVLQSCKRRSDERALGPEEARRSMRTRK